MRPRSTKGGLQRQDPFREPTLTSLIVCTLTSAVVDLRV